jgi:polysaccharide deacetylase family protein (PEP-CTERM system associated)
MSAAAPAVLKKTLPAGLLSVDVEDYFHVEAFADRVDRRRWEDYPSRVESNTRTVMDLFDECNVRGTFFILGWVADRHPGLVAEIVHRGHEAACHSYWHRLVSTLSVDEFREDTLRAKQSIEQAAGVAVCGYRAPSFSVTRKSFWALEVLAELGFRYDSSIFPIHHDTYGIPEAPRAPFRVDTPAGSLVEFPMTTVRWLGSPNLPIGGGGYLRIFPFWVTKLGIRNASDHGLPLMTYTHPWEVDPGQPRLKCRLSSRLRHYTNLGKTTSRMRDLTAMVRFSSFRESGLVDTTLALAPSSLVGIPA